MAETATVRFHKTLLDWVVCSSCAWGNRRITKVPVSRVVITVQSGNGLCVEAGCGTSIRFSP